MAYCSECGTEVDPSANFCTACGADVEESATTAEDLETALSRGAAPTWPLYGLVVCWVAWIAALPAATGGNPLGIVALLAIVASLALLYVDASNAKDAGEIELDYPILVPVVVLLLWALALPVYVAYRFYKR